MDAEDFLFEKVICFPLAVTENNKKKAVRVFGLIAFFIWFFPVAVIMLPMILILIVIDMFRKV
jgi:hypothetical protein